MVSLLGRYWCEFWCSIWLKPLGLWYVFFICLCLRYCGWRYFIVDAGRYILIKTSISLPLRSILGLLSSWTSERQFGDSDLDSHLFSLLSELLISWLHESMLCFRLCLGHWYIYLSKQVKPNCLKSSVQPQVWRINLPSLICVLSICILSKSFKTVNLPI